MTIQHQFILRNFNDLRDYPAMLKLINTGNHNWQLNEDGTVDAFAYSHEFHNGPICKDCGYDFCVFCIVDRLTELPKCPGALNEN